MNFRAARARNTAGPLVVDCTGTGHQGSRENVQLRPRLLGDAWLPKRAPRPTPRRRHRRQPAAAAELRPNVPP
ncbi:hypothetical protein MTO96_013419 [Rhipicephalus appendiculatus]